MRFRRFFLRATCATIAIAGLWSINKTAVISTEERKVVLENADGSVLKQTDFEFSACNKCYVRRGSDHRQITVKLWDLLY